MKVVMCVRGQDTEHRMRRHASRKQLETAVADNVPDDHVKHEQVYDRDVQRQDKYEDCQEQRLNHGLHGRKGIRRPRRRAVRFMMQPVKPFEHARMVHQAMRPIEIGIVKHDGHGQTEGAVKPAVIREIRVNERPAVRHRDVDEDAVERKDERREKRIEYLAPDRMGRREARLDLASAEGITLPDVESEKRDTRRNDNEQHVRTENGGPRRQGRDQIVESGHGCPFSLRQETPQFEVRAADVPSSATRLAGGTLAYVAMVSHATPTKATHETMCQAGKGAPCGCPAAAIRSTPFSPTHIS